jgi:transcription antitermination factor NusG
MKYSEKNPPIVCMQKNSSCYKGTSKMTPKGVLWHDTGCNNTKVARYVQPHETDSNYKEMIALLGTNRYENDWNHKAVQKGVNAFIGKLADGSVAAVQTLPWDYKPWGCGKGSKGSLNNTHMQFEICQDDMNSADYFNKVYKEACELTAYYCKMYNLNPHGTFTYQGVKVPVITSHKESHSLKMGSNHGDPIKWLKKYGKTMDDVRNDVAKLMNAQEEKVEQPKQPEKVEDYSFTLGEEVKLVSGAKYSSGKSIASWVFKKTLYVRAINGENITISTLKTGAVTGTVNAKYLVSLNPSVAKPTPAPAPAPEPSSPVTPSETTLKVGDTVKLVAGAKYASGKSIASWVFKKTLYVRAINGDKITISTLKTGAVTGTVFKKDLTKV